MKNYLDVLKQLVDSKCIVPCRPETRSKMITDGLLMVFDLDDGFPLVTTKLVRLKSVWAELEWMLSGQDNINEIMVKKYGVKFWKAWADETGRVGPMYGVQWRDFNEQEKAMKREESLADNFSNLAKAEDHRALACCRFLKHDQIKKAQRLIDNEKYSRRNLVSAWNPIQLMEMALPPCHFAHQWTYDGDRLHLHLFIRSWDFFIGAPFNIAFYSLLLMMMAKRSELKPGKLIIHASHVHLYERHWKLAELQLSRAPVEKPIVKFTSSDLAGKDLWDFEYSDIELLNYNHHKEIKAGVDV